MTLRRRSAPSPVVPREFQRLMKAHTRKKTIPDRGAKGDKVKAQSKSKVMNLPGTQAKASSKNRPAALSPGSEPRSSTSTGRTQKPGNIVPRHTQSGRESKVLTVRGPGRVAIRFPIVGIGASAGGLEACTLLLQHLPPDTGMGFVLVQHLDPAHASALTQLLARATRMPVREVSNNMPVEPNHVYVIPPNTTLAIARGNLKLQPRLENSGAHRSIDLFLD